MDRLDIETLWNEWRIRRLSDKNKKQNQNYRFKENIIKAQVRLNR